MDNFKSVVKGAVVAVAGWIVGAIALTSIIGLIFGVLVATVLAGGGFLIWLLVKHPKLGAIAADVVLNSDDEWDSPRERHEQLEEERQGNEYLDRLRRGDPRDST